MKILFVVLGVVAFLATGGVIMEAKSVMHEIFAGTLAVAGCVLFAGAGIIDAIEKIPETQLRYEAKMAREMAAAKPIPAT